MPADVAVTGIGIVSAAGRNREETWSILLSDGRAVCRLEGGAYPESPPSCGAPIHGFRPPPGTEFSSRTTQLAIAAAGEAIESAGLNRGHVSAVPVMVSTSKPLVDLLICGRDASEDRNLFAVQSPCTYFDLLPDAPARAVSSYYGLGRCHTSVSACATGAHTIIRAAEMIADGEADIVLAGSADSSLSPLWLAAYRKMGVLADEHPELGPVWACRPFDRDRSGFAVGEGAAMLVLESADSATRRGARVLARLTGWAAGSDPAGLVQLSERESPLSEVVRETLRRAGLRPSDFSCIYAHGTATQSNDAAEIDCFRRVFGRHLTSLPVVSIKGSLGHLMGAAGAVEIALAVLAIRDSLSPGTSTLVLPDPGFADACLPRSSFALRTGPILKTSLGFGGHLAAVAITPP